MNMNKIGFLKKKMMELLAVFGTAIIPTFLICCLPWGSYGWMGSLDFKKVSYDEASTHFVNIRLSKNIPLQFHKDEKVLEAGTEIKVLGIYQILPEREEIGGWVIQTPAGERGFCPYRFLSNDVKTPTVLLYDHSRKLDAIRFHTIVDESIVKPLVDSGITLNDFDKRFGPAICIKVDTVSGTKEAIYNGLDYCSDGEVKHGMVAHFSNDILVSVNEYGSNDTWCPDFLSYYADSWMRKSLAFFAPGFYQTTHEYGFLQSSFYPYKWIARGVMGIFDVLFAFLIAAIANLLVIILFSEDKNKSNSFMGWIVFAICGVAYSAYCYYTMELSSNLFCFGFTTIVLLIISFDYENRCSKCHSLVEMEILDKSYGRIETEIYDTDHSKDHFVRKTEIKDGYQEVVDREYYTRRMEEDHRKVTTTYRCPICGYTFKHTHDEKLGTRWSKWSTGKDRITTTTTFKVR